MGAMTFGGGNGNTRGDSESGTGAIVSREMGSPA